MEFKNASKENTADILAIYRAAVGTPYCTWSLDYPKEAEIEFDLSRNALFCLFDGTRIAGVVSLDLDENVEKLGCWSEDLQPSVELSRLGVHPDYQNRGIAGSLLQNAMKTAKELGNKSVHFLVAKSNIKAIRAYDKVPHRVVSECTLFGENWWCYEIALNG